MLIEIDAPKGRRVTEQEMRELLKWVYQQSREALFERTHHSAAKAALTALSEINHKLGQFRN